ncbi:methyltransferase [Legionella geestiana]|nr:methyltransferase [Legionella geestiana]
MIFCPVQRSGPEYGEVWSDNGGHELYHASLSTEEYQQLLIDNHFKVLVQIQIAVKRPFGLHKKASCLSEQNLLCALLD